MTYGRRAARFLIIGLFLLWLVGCSVSPNQSALSPKSHAVQISEDKAFLGVGHRVVDVSHLTDGRIKKAYQITVVIPDSAAYKAGIQQGDYILSFDENVLDGISSAKQNTALRAYLSDYKSVGASIVLSLARLESKMRADGQSIESDLDELQSVVHHPGINTEQLIHVEHTVNFFETIAVLGQRSTRLLEELPIPETLLFHNQIVEDSWGELAWKVAHYRQAAHPWYDLKRRFAQDALWQGQSTNWCRHDVFQYMRLRPKHFVHTAHFIAQESSKQSLLDLGHAWLFDEKIPTEFVSWNAGSIEELLQLLEHQLNKAERHRKHAFAALSGDEQIELLQLSQKVQQRFIGSFYINLGKGNAQQIDEENMRFFELVNQVNASALWQAAQTVEAFQSASLMTRVQQLIEEDTVFPIVRETSNGRIIISGTDSNQHRQPAAVHIDLGGDDTYYGVNQAQGRIAVLIDMEGDDTYAATSAFSQGAALMGVSLLVDKQGDDTYIGRDFAQGAAWIGVGQLIDEAGNDRYHMMHYGQGVGFWGMSVLADKQGDDIYQGALYAQGVGGTCGLGLLRDSAGNDRYQAGQSKPSSYGVEGHFQAASQGIGIGFRGYARGGIGMLLDGAGDDYYQADNFSMGVGYFFGLGLIHDKQGNDIYKASRYGIGASAHSAIGVVLDDEGDDDYSGGHIALMGAAWDLGMSLLHDKQGNDRYGYFPNGFNIGSAAHNGFSLQIDEQGNDRYVIVNEDQVHRNDYHGGWSMGFRFDVGGEDVYDFKGANNQFQQSGKYGFSIDWHSMLPRDKSLKELLSRIERSALDD